MHECGGPLLTSAGDFADVLDLGRRPHLPRTVGYWAEAVTDPEQATALLALHGAAGLGGDLNIDGSIGSHTAHLRAGLRRRPRVLGTAYRSSADVRDHVAACAVAGIQSGFHVIGDAGMDTVLEGYEAAAGLVGLDACGPPPALEHAEMVDADGSPGWRAWAWSASVQPAFDAMWGGAAGMYEARLGRARVRAPTRSPAWHGRGCAWPSARTRRSRRSTRGPRSVRPSSTTTLTSGSTSARRWRRTLPAGTRRPASTGEGRSGSAAPRPSPPGTRRHRRPGPARGASRRDAAHLPVHRPRRCGARHRVSARRQLAGMAPDSSGAPTSNTDIIWASIV